MNDKELQIIDYIKIILTQKKFIILAMVIVIILAALISFILPKWYKATVVLLPPTSEGPSFSGLSASLGAFGLGSIFGGNEDQFRLVAILRSRSLLEAMNDKYNFQERYKLKILDDTFKKLRSNIAIHIGDEEQIIFSFSSKDQDEVANMTNYAIYCLDSINISLATNQAMNSREFVEKRILLVQDSLLILEKNIEKFMKTHGIISISDQMTASVENAADLKAKIMSKEIELELKKTYLDVEKPEILLLLQEITLLRNNYSNFFIDSANDQLFINFNEIPKIERELLRLKRQAEYYIKLLEYLGPQYEQARIEEAKDVPTIQVLDKAARPDKRDKPRRALFVIKISIVAFIISLYIAYFRGKKNYPRSQ